MSVQGLLKGTPHPIYLVLGDEALLVDRAADQLAEWALTGVQRSFDHAVFRAADENVLSLFSMARTMPMLSPHRVLELRNLNEASVELLDELQAWCSTPHRGAVVIVRGRAFPPRSKHARPIETAAKKTGAVVRFKSRDQDPAAFAQYRASEMGCTLGASEARQIVATVGTDLGRIAREIEKAALYLGGEGTITSEILDQVCSLLAEAAVWDLTDAIVTRNADQALATAHRLLEARQPPHRLIFNVTWQMRQLLQLQDAMRHGGDAGARMPGWKRKKLERSLRSHPLDEARVLSRIARANQDMNSHRAGDRRVFEALLLDLVAG
ncbi:MAG: DNA polymerase III subunit delta [Proteobacteria bacterium]|nr:DNA polymerase III subunit delta [Pseudomonadota bacterium]MCP4920176.1 DNA polymerase III subunit delta [Pseudomonadota bacterium]